MAFIVKPEKQTPQQYTNIYQCQECGLITHSKTNRLFEDLDDFRQHLVSGKRCLSKDDYNYNNTSLGNGNTTHVFVMWKK